jgi:hypothetical protein
MDSRFDSVKARLYILLKAQTGSGVHPSLLLNGYRGILLPVLPKLKKEWSCKSVRLTHILS